MEDEGGVVLAEEMKGVAEQVFRSGMTRRGLLRLFGRTAAAVVMAAWPFEVIAEEPEVIVVVVTAKDPKRNSFGAIVAEYCDAEKLLRYYHVADVRTAQERLGRFNGIVDIDRVGEGKQIKIPRVLLKKDISAAAQKEERRKKLVGGKGFGPQNTGGMQSPFGGGKKSDVHLCFQGTVQNPKGLQARICPFDQFGARRRARQLHGALDVWGKIGTKLYPLKPGRVIGAGEYYLDSAGREMKFKFFHNNGNAVKIQTDDGFVYMYIHLKRVFVNLGDRVDYDTAVGELGVSGNASAANPHVHITMYYDGRLVDPLRYLEFLK